jgi:hypothetical protein
MLLGSEQRFMTILELLPSLFEEEDQQSKCCFTGRSLQYGVADSGFCAFLTPGSRMGKKLGSGSGMNNPNHISESLETIFLVKILKFFDADPGWQKVGSGINIPDPQHFCNQSKMCTCKQN